MSECHRWATTKKNESPSLTGNSTFGCAAKCNEEPVAALVMVDYIFVYVEIGLLVLFTFKMCSLQIADILRSMFKFSSILNLFYIFRVELSQPEYFISTEWRR